MTTFTAAKTAARALGYTLRRATPGDSEIVVYPVGTGADNPAAYFTSCPVDALDTARAMAAANAAPTDGNGEAPYTHVCSGCGADMGPDASPYDVCPDCAPKPRARPARRKAMTRRDLAAMAADCGASPVARDLAALSLTAVAIAPDSGAFPLYAFRDGAEIIPDDLDSMAYGPAMAGLI